MDLLFRLAILSVAYFYPAYKCFKAIECGKPKSEQLHMWCQYWIIIALFTGFERVADIFISWLPFYSGAKLAFVVYLWHPDTKGTQYVYQTFLKPLVSNNMESMEFRFVILQNEAARFLRILWSKIVLQIQAKASQMVQGRVIESPSVASQAVQASRPSYFNNAKANIPLHPPITTSLYWSNMQQQRSSVHLGHQALVTKSAVWSDEVDKKECQNSVYTIRSLLPLALEQQKRLSPVVQYSTLNSQRDLKSQDLGAVVAASVPSNIAEQRDNGSDKEETDFELVHFSEVPKPESVTCGNSMISAQGARSRWWWR